MRFKDSEILEQLAQTASSFNEGFKEREYPEVQLAKFLTITSEGGADIDEIDYGEMDGTQNLDNGLIDENTTSLETEDIFINAKKAPCLVWAKSAIYTDEAVRRASRLGISLDTTKLANLERVALLAMQKTALIGHAKLKKVSGLLTNQGVKTQDLTSGKKLSEMTGVEARDFFLRLIDAGFERNGGLVVPNTIAIDSRDLMDLAGKFDDTIGSGKVAVNVLANIKEAVKEATSENIEIVGVPLGFAKDLGGKGKNRVAVYTNAADVVSVNWAMHPQAIAPFQRSVLSWEVAIKAKFTGALIRQLDKVLYADYKA
ncbi:major capsid family protein [Campylobacter mucosalis]|uniref:major capsid family protein n=1 Tax=Campylobacter mucosalis TaxID=202 RepID=UPI0014700D98|nr:major capsid family protein [Campylobacter mucosalis]